MIVASTTEQVPARRVQIPTDFGRVAVLMGGTSAEREVSLNSGAAVLQALQAQGVDAYGVDVADNAIANLDQDTDRVFIALHGRGGEDGALQGALETLGIPYTGTGVTGSALGMDKQLTKMVWQSAAQPTARFWMATDDLDYADVQLPVMVKPAREGSSIGMSKANSQDELRDAITLARKNDDAVLLEQFITGREYTVAVLGDMVLPIIQMVSNNEFYDYEAKYLRDDTQYLCPCGLAPTVEADIQTMAYQAFKAVHGAGWGRVDVMIDDNSQQALLLEVNTVPGMTDHSLVPMAARQVGIEFPELCWRILETSL